MSASMYWRAEPKELPPKHNVDRPLHSILARRYLDQDGTLSCDPFHLGGGALDYLLGLADAGVEGAVELAAAIQTHDVIELWIE